MTAPAAAPKAGTASAIAGVGSTPSETTSTPAAARPAASAGLEHRAAAPGVAADEHPPMAAHTRAQRPPDLRGKLRRELAVGDAADAVRAEQPANRLRAHARERTSASRTAAASVRP